jgi:hypothetical protein
MTFKFSNISQGDWEGLIANLREAHRNLPALQDELNRVRL